MSWLLFVAKKVVSAFIYPLGASLLLWLVGIICWRRRPRSYAGPVLVTVGAVWLLVMSLPVTGFFLLHSLEAQAGQYADPIELSRNGVKYIVVLGGDLRAREVDLRGPNCLQFARKAYGGDSVVERAAG